MIGYVFFLILSLSLSKKKKTIFSKQIGTFSGHKGAVWSAKLNKDATKAVTGSADFSVKLWNAVTGKVMRTYDHKHIVKTVDFDPSGSRVLSGGMEKMLRVFDINKDSASLELKRESAVRKALWQDDSNILMATDDGMVSVVTLTETVSNSQRSIRVPRQSWTWNCHLKEFSWSHLEKV